MDKWELKKKKSMQKAAAIKGRAKVWEDINGESKGVRKEGKTEEGEGEKGSGRRWVGDEEMGGAGGEGAGGTEVAEGVVQETSVAPAVQEDELL